MAGKLHRITKRGFTMIRIAIVEDDTGYRSQLGKYIDQYQSDFSETVSVSEFSDGLEIVEKYKSEYDIILMDIQMKHMDGMQAAMRIRDMDKNVIIIFITTTLIISKKPGNTGISRDIRTEFTTDLLLSD